MTESVKKALEMDEVEDGTLTRYIHAFMNSVVNNPFQFNAGRRILHCVSLFGCLFMCLTVCVRRKCIRRSITSSSVDCVCAMLNNGVTLLETEFIKQLNGPIKARSPFHVWRGVDLLAASYELV